MAKSTRKIDLPAAERLVDGNDRYWWETYGKTLIHFTPGRNRVPFARDAIHNPKWRGAVKWGTGKRIEVGSDGTFTV